MGLVWVLAADRELMDAGLGGCTWVHALGVTKLGSIPILGSAGCVRRLPMSQWCALTENIFKPGFIRRPRQLFFKHYRMSVTPRCAHVLPAP